MRIIFKRRLPDYNGRRFDIGDTFDMKDDHARNLIGRGFADEIIGERHAAPQKKAAAPDPTRALPAGSPAGSASASSSSRPAPAPISSTTTASPRPRRRASAGSPASTKAGG